MDLVNLSGFSPAWLVWKIQPPAWSLTVIVKGTFRLVPDGPAVRAEEQLPPAGNEHLEEDPERALRYENDFAPFKAKADLLLAGTCHSPSGKPTDLCGVNFGLGNWSKRLAVVSKSPFIHMQVSYENAYGGPKFKQNPIGTEAPTVISPDQPEKKIPAGFAPIPQAWPQRMAKAGKPSSFGKDWLKTRWPWWPDGFDWSYYNAAPEDQQLERLTGNEELRLENLHPKHPRFRCRLPGLRVRAFTREKSDFREIPMILDTLWADPEAERLILVWRGHQNVRTRKLEDISHLLIACESLSEPPRAKEEHGKKLDEALAEKSKPFEAEAPGKGSAPPPPTPKPPEIPPQMQAKVEAAEKQLADLDKQAQQLEAQAIERAKQAGGTWPPAPVPIPTGIELQKQFLGSLLKAKENLLASGQRVPPKLEEAIRNPPDASEFEVAKPAEPEEPDTPPPEAPPPPAREDVQRRIAAKESLAGRDLTGLDLSGMDLSGADFRKAILKDANLSKTKLTGADFSDATLVGTRLSEADARKATFTSADMSTADLSGIDFTEAKLVEALFVGACLSKAKLALADASGADFSKADLTAADLRKAKFARAMLPEARLDNVDLSGANFSGAALMRASGREVIGEGADLTGLRAAGARLEAANFKRVLADGSIWESATLSKANFSFAQLKKAEFSSANLEAAVMVAANMPEARFVEANLRKADLTRANLFQGTLEKADLTGAIFAECNLYEAETWEAILEGADFRSANVKGSKLAMK